MRILSAMRAIFLTLLVPAVLLTQTASASNIPPNGLTLLDFRLGWFAAFQSPGSSFSGQLSWNPLFRFGENVGLRGNFGATLLNQAAGSNFMVASYELLLSFDLNATWNIELGGGAQTFFQTPSQTGGIGSFNLGYKLDEKLFAIIDRVYLGYSTVFFNPLAHEYKLGLQISI